jgi:hypothetical protein
MSHSFPSNVSVVYCWQKNECQESGAVETLALLTVAYGEYAMKKSSVSEWHGLLKEGREDVQDDPRSVSLITSG